jgi:acylphosphatase
MNDSSKQPEVAYFVTVEGRVTGVGFRWSALSYANGLPDLKGWIRNADYAVVETLVQGPETEVNKMIAWLRRGPSFARVDNIKINPEPVNEHLPPFTIR